MDMFSAHTNSLAASKFGERGWRRTKQQVYSGPSCTRTGVGSTFPAASPPAVVSDF